MSGIMTALKTHNGIDLVSQQINNLALTLNLPIVPIPITTTLRPMSFLPLFYSPQLRTRSIPGAQACLPFHRPNMTSHYSLLLSFVLLSLSTALRRFRLRAATSNPPDPALEGHSS